MRRFALTLGIAIGLGQPLMATAAEHENPIWNERTAAIGAVSSTPSGTLSRSELEQLTKTGEALFSAKFTTLDGAGRPRATQAIIPTKPRHAARLSFARTSGPDANACSSCHNDPVIGGAGDFATTTFVAEGFTLPDFDSTDPQFSNERGTNHLMGAGLIELLAREMTSDLHDQRRRAIEKARNTDAAVTIALETKGVSFGSLTARPDGLADLSKLEGVDADLVIRPFGQKGVIGSLRQFTINAMNAHHGMQASERFGRRWTASADFDEDGYEDELGVGDVSALVAWQATLPAPVQDFDGNEEWQTLAQKGRAVFNDLGCASCHIPALPLSSLEFADPGPLDAAGTLARGQVQDAAVYDLSLLDWARRLPRNEQGDVLVPLFGDLKRHTMTDAANERLGNELLAQRFVDRTSFATAELWGIGSTAPYGHRNDITTLDEMIRAHAGDARRSRDAYAAATDNDRRALIAFLRSLRIGGR
ncbi:MAG: hypothetical protein OXR62_01505 [Ahrensia sp.]|nr:hypothetical protein [Ahrensia sp.]